MSVQVLRPQTPVIRTTCYTYMNPRAMRTRTLLYVLVLSEVFSDYPHRLGDIALVSPDVNFRFLRGFVRGRDAGELCRAKRRGDGQD